MTAPEDPVGAVVYWSRKKIEAEDQLHAALIERDRAMVTAYATRSAAKLHNELQVELALQVVDPRRAGVSKASIRRAVEGGLKRGRTLDNQDGRV